MGKKHLIFIFILVLILLCSCTNNCSDHSDYNYDLKCDKCGVIIESELVDLEKSLKNNFSIISQKMQSVNDKFFDIKYEIYTKESLSDENKEAHVNVYGEGFTKAANIFTLDVFTGEYEWQLLAIEYESAEAASIGLSKLHKHNDLFQYKNCLITHFKGRSLLFQEGIEINGCQYTADGHILVDGYTASKVELPDSVFRIDAYAFTNSYFIKELVCNEKLEKIGFFAFCGATNLKTVKLNNNLESIEMQAFLGTNLEYIVIPESVVKIGYCAFENSVIYCEATSMQSGWDENCFFEGTTVYYKGEWEYNSEGIPTPR